MTRQDEIAMAAYELYVKGGFADGRDEEHWLAAEKKILATAKPVKMRKAVKKAPLSSAPKKRRPRKNM